MTGFDAEFQDIAREIIAAVAAADLATSRTDEERVALLHKQLDESGGAPAEAIRPRQEVFAAAGQILKLSERARRAENLPLLKACGAALKSLLDEDTIR